MIVSRLDAFAKRCRRLGAKVKTEDYFFLQRLLNWFFCGCVLVVQVFVLSVANQESIAKRGLKASSVESDAYAFSVGGAIATTNIALDGLNSSVRNRATNLTALIAQAMLGEVESADLAIFNSGLIQDDYIPPGKITQDDIIRVLPGDKVLAVEMNGSLLERVLEKGRANRGTSGYLQTANVSKKLNLTAWLIKGEPLDPSRNYTVAINEFLISGKQKNLEFLNFNQHSVRLIARRRDIRLAVIEQLR